MAVSVNSNEDFRGARTLVGFLTHPERYDWILGAMDDHDRGSDLVKLIFSIELPADKQWEPWEKPEGPPRDHRGGREWGASSTTPPTFCCAAKRAATAVPSD
jgi:hypothetical protein